MRKIGVKFAKRGLLFGVVGELVSRCCISRYK